MTVVDTAPAAEAARFTELLLAMSYADPQVRPLLDLEGLRVWREGRTSGYAQLETRGGRGGLLRRRRAGDRRGVRAVTAPDLDLGRLGFTSGAHLLVDRALRGAAPGAALHVVGRRPGAGRAPARLVPGPRPRVRRAARGRLHRPTRARRAAAVGGRGAGGRSPAPTGWSGARPRTGASRPAARSSRRAARRCRRSTWTTATSSGPTSRRGCTPTPPPRSGTPPRRWTGPHPSRCRTRSRPPSFR